MVRRTILALVGFGLLDGLWLGVVMNRYYREQLSAIARLRNGQFAPVWPAALLVYALLAIGTATLVTPRADNAASAAGYGAIFGLVVYGVYDLTNYSTLTNYPLTLAVVDLAWGVVACAACAAAVRLLS